MSNYDVWLAGEIGDKEHGEPQFDTNGSPIVERGEADTLTQERARELAELAISYLQDNGLFEDFAEDRDVELSEEEREYFGIEKEEEEDW